MDNSVFTNPEKAKLHIFLVVIICWFEWAEIFEWSDKSSLIQTMGGKGIHTWSCYQQAVASQFLSITRV